MRSRWALAVTVWAFPLTACNAKLEDGVGIRSQLDSGPDTPGDAPSDGPPMDMPPDTAMLDCSSGGDARAIDTTTNTCLRYFMTPLLFQAAQDQCALINSDLVMIKSAATNAAVDAIVPGRAWIGATDTAVEMTFVWLDGSALVYTNWRTGEPNNQGPDLTDEDCAQIEATGLWDDRTCVLVGAEGPYPYVCQTRP